MSEDLIPETKTAGKAPSHVAYPVCDREGTRIGAAGRINTAKASANQLDSLVALDGRISLRIGKESGKEA